ncbi:MAG TPA: 3-deoxy-7-phosphoheptulonate synthase [Chthoniobacterales bacterium]|jgi:3-deoxy-7-phosphoheptulonate synthase|nr:3-deoxy-7-phosphoheptulonate synthase [Chthoniobacterales bacterium]
MIIITQPTVTDAQIDHIVARIEEFGLRPQVIRGETRVVIGVIGPEDLIRGKPIAAIPGVESVVPVMKPYKLVSQENGSLPPPVLIGGVKIGSGQRVVLISGPCSVESKQQLLSIANSVKEAGARVLRGGAFKPRTSPYSFQGLGEDGLRFLAEARAETGLPIITEIMDTRDLPVIEKYADCLQIGARNMQNFALLKEVGRSRLPVLLKRGLSATINELLMSAEYILSEGNPNVLLCERGIRTFETMTRNTLDLNAVPILKAKTRLPVVVDPTHGIGLRDYVPQMALAAVAAGADGLMIEVHNEPDRARSDGEQALRPEIFSDLVRRIRAVAEAVGREL